MCWKSSKSLTVLDISTLTFLGYLFFMMILTRGYSTKSADTCGHDYFLPMFNECDLYLRASPCTNQTHKIFVTMTTLAGEVVHSFYVLHGTMAEFSLQGINKVMAEGLIVKSNGDMSLYLHQALGDAMVIYPIDALSRDYETPSLSSHRISNDSRSNNTLFNGLLYMFSPYNNTNITITSLHATVESPSTLLSSSTSTLNSSSIFSSLTSITLDAFDIQKYYIDTYRRYRLHSENIFAVIVVQTQGLFEASDRLCQNSTLSLMDFVPPYSTSGKYFFIAFPTVIHFSVFIMGPKETSVVLITDNDSTEIILDQSGSNITDVSKTSTSWMYASHPVTIYIKITLCSNVSSPTKLCADSGFFLPSVEQYFTCERNTSKDECECSCPSVFQRDFDSNSFRFDRDTNELVSVTPLNGEFFDVTLSILSSPEFKKVTDVIVNTNTSFIIFRYSLGNLNFLPGGSALGAIQSLCNSDTNKPLPLPCHDTESINISSQGKGDMETSENVVSELNQCACEFLQGIISNNADVVIINSLGSSGSKIRQIGADEDFLWVEDEEDTTRPLIAVVVSLCVSIFAVIALISGYMLVEIMTRRKHVRNTKIRPFVS